MSDTITDFFIGKLSINLLKNYHLAGLNIIPRIDLIEISPAADSPLSVLPLTYHIINSDCHSCILAELERYPCLWIERVGVISHQLSWARQPFR